MSRSARADAISFFLTPVGVLRSSGGDRHVPEAERNVESYKNFDLKSRFFFGKVKKTRAIPVFFLSVADTDWEMRVHGSSSEEEFVGVLELGRAAALARDGGGAREL